MGFGIQAYIVILPWINMLTIPSWAQVFLDNKCEEHMKYTIKNHNGERMEILWNAREDFPNMNVTMFYKFDRSEEKHCPQYILEDGYNTGCLFQTEGHDLEIFIRDKTGTQQLYFDEQESIKFFKPNPPENVTFKWADDEVTVQCKPPSKGDTCFRIEMQYKSRFDKEWQSQDNQCCEIKSQGFDLKKCYSFRLRLNHTCTHVPYVSEWGAETFLENGNSVDSCTTDDYIFWSQTVIPLTSVMASLLVVFALLMSVCRSKNVLADAEHQKMQKDPKTDSSVDFFPKIKKTLLPIIPDPKHVYSNLFSDHSGDFQEWIKKTENVTLQTKVEYEEQACVIEEEKGGDVYRV